MIKVYQIVLTNKDINLINSQGWDATAKTSAYAGRSFVTAINAEYFEHYTHVCNVQTDDLEHAFDLMNLWEDESLIERLGTCCSMSVGDIVETEDGRRFLCASFGFKEI